MTREEALKVLGGRTDEYWSELYDNQGAYYRDLETYIWAGLFGFCCCGDPQLELDKIRETLSYAYEHKALPNELQIYGYLLDYWEFTQHGFSIYTARLTEKGEAVLTLLNELEK